VMLVVGDREAQSGQVAVRLRTGGDRGAVSQEEFLERSSAWLAAKSLELEWERPDDKQKHAADA